MEICRRAVALDPKCWGAHTQLRLNLMQLQKWEEARVEWQQVLALEPPEHEAWDGYAEFCLYLGNEAEYRRVRTELLKRFGNSTDPQMAERTGRACLFLPAADDELRQATILVDRALSADRATFGWCMPYFRFAKALSEYRAGRLETTLTLLDADTIGVLGPAPRLLLAMVQHRLGKADAARATFKDALANFDWGAKATDREAWMYHILRREAETVLASKP